MSGCASIDIDAKEDSVVPWYIRSPPPSLFDRINGLGCISKELAELMAGSFLMRTVSRK
jgi:hypothetical protein